jgi:peptidoglycan/LPS O-acetylase OafA/YrhL
MKRLAALDGIRGLAIALVLMAHLGQILNVGMAKIGTTASLAHLLIDGWIGVDIFFVLSGFLITGIILEERGSERFWTNFYLRRAFRILPAFVVIIAVAVIGVRIFNPSNAVPLAYVLSAGLFVANLPILAHAAPPLLSHLWSLAVEEQFYLIWPQAAKRLSAELLFKIALGVTIGCELLRIILSAMNVPIAFQYEFTFTHCDGLTVGAALAVGLTLPHVEGFLGKRWRTIAVGGLIALPASLLLRHSGFSSFNLQVLRIPPAIIVTSMLIFAAVKAELPAILSRFFTGSVITYLGRRSYALYLVNRPIQVVVSSSRAEGYLSRLPHGVPTNLMLMAAVIVVSLLMAEISWRLIESPAQALRVRLMRGEQGGSRRYQAEEVEVSELAKAN